MTNRTSILQAEAVLGNNFIGPEKILADNRLGLAIPEKIDDVPFAEELLQDKKDAYLLIFGISRFKTGKLVTIRNLISIVGKNPDIMEPCFYNQDWYENEDFVDLQMKEGWYFIKKSVYEDSRAISPDELSKRYRFPLAIVCAYSFFVAWFATGETLWNHDYVWCSDKDHNGDRIYIGKYHDIDGKNKNGFSIHRHLSLRSCYACID